MLQLLFRELQDNDDDNDDDDDDDDKLVELRLSSAESGVWGKLEKNERMVWR